MHRPRIRHQLFLSPEISERLEKLAAQPGASKSDILATALTAWIDSRGTSEVQARFQARLDGLSRQLGRLERNDHILIETLALFIRYELNIQAPLAEDDVAGRMIGQERYNSFVDLVARRLAGGQRSFVPEDDR